MKKTLLSLAACAMMAGTADAAMYIVGDPAGKWSPQTGIEMTEADGGYKWTGNVASGQWFAFATQLLDSDDWDTFNSTYRLNPQDNGTFAEAGEYTLEIGGKDRAFQGNGENVTFFIKEVGGVYTLTVTEHETIPLYLIGQPDGHQWSPMEGIRMKNVDGGWEWSGFVAETDYFAFATQLMDSEDWDTFNANYRISPDENGVAATTGEYPLHLGNPEGACHGNNTNVTYFVKEVDGAYTLVVTENGEPVIPDDPGFPEDATWSVVGQFNNWGQDPDFQMTKIRDGVWKATMYNFSGEFKFRANNSWDINLGIDGEVGTIEGDGDFALVVNGGNFYIPEEVEEVIFELDVKNLKLTVDGLTPSMLALRGSFVDWAFEWSYLFMEVDEGIYSLYLDGIEADWEFKISDQEWTEFYTTGVSDMKAGEIYPLIDRDGPNMGVDNSYTDVTMFLNLEDEYFTFYGELAAVEAVNEIATGKARFFNLQGVEVTNPSNGIFVRVMNGKSEKITVK